MHHVPHTLSSAILPAMSRDPILRVRVESVGSANVGICLPISADGT